MKKQSNPTAGTFESNVETVREKLAATLKLDPSELSVTGAIVSLPRSWHVTVDPIAQRYEVQHVIGGMTESSHYPTTLAHLRRVIGNNKQHIL